MLWFLVPHIAAMLIWTASLLYLPTLIIGSVTHKSLVYEPKDRFDSIPRFMFTRIATPAALVAIIAGTWVFIVDQTVDTWLIAKLTLVAGLAVCHTLTGLMILRSETDDGKPVVSWCWVLMICIALLMSTIFWLVLAKPDMEQVL